jgi:Asp-tRNA(Asn)/Glu-tRNA(Gln) amidotransferase A subunit family amidase
VIPPTDLRRLARAIRSRQLSPTEHVADVLDRLRTDPHNAVVALDEGRALARAEQLTAEIARGGWRGPLHGVAIGVKDLIDVAGLPTRAGSTVLTDARPAAADASVVARLTEAGAVVVAKLHTHEFGYGPTGDVAATGPARNPRAPERITGGSSSGSAAAVAAGHLPLAIGTDTGGSVRIPAALCGVVGLKPAFGRLPTDGVFPLSETCDHVGLLAADVPAAATAWDVLSGPADSETVRSLAGALVGIPVDDYWRAHDPVLDEAAAAAAEALQRRGARVVDVPTPMIDDLAAAYLAIVGAEGYATHAAWLAERPGDYQPATRAGIAPFADQPAREYVDALRARRRLSAAWRRALGDVDVLVLPATRLRATPIGSPLVESGGEVVAVGHSLLALTLPFNLTGMPAVSVPSPADGLPAGVQLVGVRLDERDLLRVASALAGHS